MPECYICHTQVPEEEGVYKSSALGTLKFFVCIECQRFRPYEVYKLRHLLWERTEEERNQVFSKKEDEVC
jgi:hypothetical protein